MDKLEDLDEVFKEKQNNLSDFEFNKKVAGVFDDYGKKSFCTFL